MMRVFSAFGLNDLRSIRRDSLLLTMLFAPWAMVLFVRYVVPALSWWLAVEYQFNLTPYYILIVSFFFLLQIPAIFGLVTGFLILDERDDNTLTALQVTPVSITSYASYRILVTILLSVFYILVTVPLSTLIQTTWGELLPAAILAGLLGTILAMALSVLASNKVEGLAVMKAIGGVLMLLPMLSYFINPNWQWLFWILPSYWPVKEFWILHNGGNGLVHFMIGLIYETILLVLLIRTFRIRIYKG